MTTNVTILNEGPLDVTVKVITGPDDAVCHQSYKLKAGTFTTNKLYVYKGQRIVIEEILPDEVTT